MACLRPLYALFAAAIFTFSSHLFATQSVSLAWDQNAENDIAGYRIYWGTVSGNYSQNQQVGTTTSTVSGLQTGTTYYFAVTAYNTNGLESGYSNEVSYKTSGTPPPPTPTPSPTSTPTPTLTPTPTPPETTPTPTPTPPETTPTPTPSPTPEPDALLNISTRVQVRDGNSVMIEGFIVSGEGEKQVVIRALGPSLAAVGVPKVLRNPELELYDSSGALLDQNSDWTSLPPGTIPPEFQPADPLEAVIIATLPAGAYTAVMRGEDGTTGVALCELYDLSPEASSVRNISTRGEVGQVDDVMIGGFIIGGITPKKVIVRAIGPALVAYGITDALSNPEVELHDSTGSLIFTNDDWRSDQEEQIIASGLAPGDDHEAAILATLPPGAYTAVVRGVDGGTGVGLIEVYSLEP